MVHCHSVHREDNAGFGYATGKESTALEQGVGAVVTC